MATKQKIGIFAGSFDPIHEGHMACAQAAAEAAQLDLVFFIVEPRPRYKQGVKAYEHRSEMTRFALADKSSYRQIVIDEPYCTTAETIPMLENRFPGSELFLIMGDDVARRITDWSQTNVLFDHAQLLVVRRMMASRELEALFARLEAVSGKQPRYQLVNTVASTLSSSDIKRQLKAGQLPEGLHRRVSAYIKQHNLYGSTGFGS